MSDNSVANEGVDSVVTNNEPTLYDMLVDVSGIKYEGSDFADTNAYKSHIVLWFNDEAEGDDRYSRAPEPLQEWVDSATLVAKNNKDARRKAALPYLDGLDNENEKAADEAAAKAEAEPAAEKKGRGRPRKDGAAATPAAEKPAKSERDPTNNVYGHVSRIVLKNPKMTVEQITGRLQKDGRDYGEVTIKRAFERAHIFRRVAMDSGIIKE